MNPPVVVDQSNILMQGHKDSFRSALARKKPEGFQLEFANREIPGCWDRIRRLGFESQHASRHVSGGCYQEIAVPAFLQEDFFHFDGALKSVAGVTLAKHVGLRYTPTDQVIAGNTVFVLGSRKGVDMTAGHNDRRRSNPIEPPGLLEAAKHGFVDTWKWDESLSRNRADGQHDNDIIGLNVSRVDERSIARFKWIGQQVANNSTVEHND